MLLIQASYVGELLRYWGIHLMYLGIYLMYLGIHLMYLGIHLIYPGIHLKSQGIGILDLVKEKLRCIIVWEYKKYIYINQIHELYNGNNICADQQPYSRGIAQDNRGRPQWALVTWCTDK